MSLNVCSKDEKKRIKQEISGTRFNTPFGKTIRKYLSHGIAVHLQDSCPDIALSLNV